MTRSVHPLLLETGFWRRRLVSVQEGPGGMLSSPRGDLSGAGRRVEEFRLKAGDGQVLWGLISFPTFFKGPRPACIRAAGPADPVELDPSALDKGQVEIIYQVPAGRRLEQRVLDLLLLHAHASRQPGVAKDDLSLSPPSESSKDEVWIAGEVLRRLPPSADRKADRKPATPEAP